MWVKLQNQKMMKMIWTFGGFLHTMRQKRSTWEFNFPAFQDIASVSLTDIMVVLPTPDQCKRSVGTNPLINLQFSLHTTFEAST